MTRPARPESVSRAQGGDHDTGSGGLPGCVDAVLFDMDGTLVDSEQAWFRAAEELWGRPLDDEMKEGLFGVAMEDVIDAYLAQFPGDRAEVMVRATRLVRDNLERGVPQMPGADDLLSRLAERVPVAVASNSPRIFVDRTIEGQGWAGQVSVWFGADDVEHGKPEPDLYLAAAEALGARIEHCVVVEDSPAGLAAGRAAGAFVVAVGPQVAGCGDLDVADLTDERLRQWRPRRGDQGATDGPTR